MIDLKYLRELAEKASSGPWEARGEYSYYPDGLDWEVCGITGPKQFGECFEIKDAVYIAAMSPDVVLKLLDNLDELKAEIASALYNQERDGDCQCCDNNAAVFKELGNVIRFTGKLPYGARGLRGAGAKSKRRRKKYNDKMRFYKEARAIVRRVYDVLFSLTGVQ